MTNGSRLGIPHTRTMGKHGRTYSAASIAPILTCCSNVNIEFPHVPSGVVANSTIQVRARYTTFFVHILTDRRMESIVAPSASFSNVELLLESPDPIVQFNLRFLILVDSLTEYVEHPTLVLHLSFFLVLLTTPS